MSDSNVPPQPYRPAPQDGSNPQDQPLGSPDYSTGSYVPPQSAYPPPPGAYPPPRGEQGNPPPMYPAPEPPLSPQADKQAAMWAHFGGILFSFLPPLIIWLLFRQRGPRTDVEAKEALNWQITIAICEVGLSIVIGILGVIFTATGMYALVSLLWMLPRLLWIANIVFCVMGGLQVNAGGSYRYPFAFRFVK